MDLRKLLDTCQGSYAEEWSRIPDSGPAEYALAGLVDLGSTEESRWTALHYMFRAVYAPNAQLALGWGVDPRTWADPMRSKDDPPAWQSEEWGSVNREYAQVVLNGSLVWQVAYSSINWGAGISGVLPWPRLAYPATEPDEPSAGPHLWTTSWEVEFARLLNDLQGNDDFDFNRELKGLDWEARSIPPIESLQV